MNKTRNILAITFIVLIIAFLTYTAIVVSKPREIILQGQAEATHVRVASKLVGRLDTLYVKRGQTVEAGEDLFRINSPELDAKLSQARAARRAALAQSNKAKNGAQEEDIQAAYNNYQKASAAADLMQKTFNRVSNLYKEGVVPEQKRDEAETKMIAAKETAQAARSIWEKAKKGARVEDKEAAWAIVSKAEGVISEVQSYMSERSITAPIKGEIANIMSEVGELVPAGFPIISIVDLDDIWITFNVREDLLSKIHKGTVLKARIPALGKDNIELKVSYISPMGTYAAWHATKTSGDFDMQTFEIHATPVKKQVDLRPGMSALVNWDEISE
ncbi:MAG: hemolysin secretion protein D [Bacteroidia bacterium]|nr:MAG: hemolysin secretion protein D [Bacteroidia bacterium]